MYIVQNWVNGSAGGTPLSADRLNYIEAGILATSSVADAAVKSVAGRTGVVLLTAADIGPGSFPAGTFNFTGTLQEAGNRVYSAGNLPPYPVTSVATRTGAVVLTAADIGAGTFPSAVSFAGLVTLTSSALAPNTKGILFTYTSGNQGYIIGSGTALQLRGGLGGFNLRNNADTLSVLLVNDTGDLNLHGTTAALLLFGRDNDTQSFVNYVNSNIWRVYSNTAAADRVTVDSNGTVAIHGSVAGLELHGKDVDANTYTWYVFQNVLRLFKGVDVFQLDASGTSPIIELGKQDGTASNPAIDFHSGTTVVDFDSRIIASGGTGVAGNGSLFAYLNDLILDIGNAGTKRFRLTSDTTNSYFQTDKPLLFTTYASGTPIVTINRGTSGTILTVSADASVNGHGAEIGLFDTKAAQATPNKFIRANGGLLQVMNNGYTAAILSLDDSGNLTAAGGLSLTPTTTTTAPTGGAAGALPANPVGYMSITIAGTVRKIPYYT